MQDVGQEEMVDRNASSMATGHEVSIHQSTSKKAVDALPDVSNSAGEIGLQTFDERSSSPQKKQSDIKIELTEDIAPEVLGFAFSAWKKWTILTVVFGIQVTMNFNSSVYANAATLIPKDPRYVGVSEQGARTGQMIFLVAYAFGCELWAPQSEEWGRWPTLFISLFLVAATQIGCALAPNFNALLAGRFFGGLCTAGGSVTLGVVADLYHQESQSFAVAYIVLSSVGGTAVGPIVGGIITGSNCKNPLYWLFWVQALAMAGSMISMLCMWETRSTILLDREAKRRRKDGELNIYGPNELKKNRLELKEMTKTGLRSFTLLFTEPIVFQLSLISGFSDSLQFLFSESFTIVYEKWSFSTLQTGLAFIPLAISYLLGFLFVIPYIMRQNKRRRHDPDSIKPEARLIPLVHTAPLLGLGLLGFAWTSIGPTYHVHWVAPMMFSLMIGLANYIIYETTIEYMIEAYGEFSASATGGNGFARDFLAGINSVFAVPMFQNIGGPPLDTAWAATILGVLGLAFCVPVYYVYRNGPNMRRKSPFAQSLAEASKVRRTKTQSGQEKDEQKA